MGRTIDGETALMNDQDARVPFDTSTSTVIPIGGDRLAVDGFSPDEVTDTLEGLERLASTYGFDNVVLHVAEALIGLRVRIDAEHVVLAEDVEQRLVGLEQRVRDFNERRPTNAAQP